MSDTWCTSSSSAIKEYRHLPDERLLEVRYVGGHDVVYAYPCSEATYEEFLVAPSKGRFVQSRLKPLGAFKRRPVVA